MGASAAQRELLEAFAAMDEREKVGLAKKGRLIGAATGHPGMDLLHEALWRTLDGHRVWTRDVPLGAHLWSVMRSMANHALEAAPATRAESLDDAALEDLADPDGWGAPDRALERKQAADAMRRAIVGAREELRGDPDARGVIEGMALGLKAAESRALLRLAPAEYKLARDRALPRLRRNAGGRP